MHATLEGEHVAHRFSPAGWEYRGFKIYTRKKTRQERYYALVYAVDSTYAGFQLGVDDVTLDDRLKVVAFSKTFIDNMIEAEYA